MAINSAGALQNLSKISGIKPLKESVGDVGNQDKSQDFKAMFNSLIENVEKTEAVTREDEYKLSIGQVDDLHTMMINAARADVALQTMVQVRNKVLEAYSEVMRINI
ncbi:MAG TPA: flagellar hook-basal body complex protein FliE [Anaerovoracaceae bacterium]|nr:flagellar hook-basal body complex protein FliE [Anaerovoracaceae bacterium]